MDIINFFLFPIKKTILFFNYLIYFFLNKDNSSMRISFFYHI
nr:MAG TPA: hypothetical protein [Caudoviricetes sp.]